jgi:FkbM family methyltransferase
MRIEEPEVSVIRHLIGKGGTAVDVGANVGFYTHALAHHFDVVHAFEPNETLIGPMMNWRHPAVHLHLVGLSSHPGTATLYVPVISGVTLSGWASLNPKWVPNAESMVRKQIKLRCMDAYNLTDVRFIKVDVEGCELDVLQGAMETIRRSRPVLLIETVGKTRTEVMSLLSRIGYRHEELQRVIGVRGSPQNMLFVPNEDSAARAY